MNCFKCDLLPKINSARLIELGARPVVVKVNGFDDDNGCHDGSFASSFVLCRKGK